MKTRAAVLREIGAEWSVEEISQPCLVESEYLTMCRPWWSSSRKSHLVDQKQKTLGVYSHRCRSEK